MPENDRQAALEQYRAPLEVYEELLRSLDDQDSYSNWVYRRDSPDASRYEGAIGEAVAFVFLRDRVDHVRLVAVEEGMSPPDIHCEVGGSQFLVEVASRQTRTATRPTTAPAEPEAWESRYMSRNWVRQMEDLVRKMSSQAKDQRLPRLILVTVLQSDTTDRHCNPAHVEAVLCESIQADPDGGPAEGTSAHAGSPGGIERALFARIGETIRPRYTSVSGFVQAGLGSYPSGGHVHGGLNPNAEHPFDPALLGDVPFASFEDWPVAPGGSVSFKWSDPARPKA